MTRQERSAKTITVTLMDIIVLYWVYRGGMRVIRWAINRVWK